MKEIEIKCIFKNYNEKITIEIYDKNEKILVKKINNNSSIYFKGLINKGYRIVITNSLERLETAFIILENYNEPYIFYIGEKNHFIVFKLFDKNTYDKIERGKLLLWQNHIQ